MYSYADGRAVVRGVIAQDSGSIHYLVESRLVKYRRNDNSKNGGAPFYLRLRRALTCNAV